MESKKQLLELAAVRFKSMVDICSEGHNFFSASTRVGSKTPQAFLDAENDRVEIRVEQKGFTAVSYVPMGNVSSYSPKA